MTCGIYRILNTQNGKCYLGSGVSIERRFRDHKRDLRNKSHCNKKLQRAWDKYGEQSFSFEVFQIVDDVSTLLSVETDLIVSLRLTEHEYGYNLCKTGRSAFGLTRSVETRQKMSASQKGKKRSPEICQQMSGARKGKKFTEERKQKLRGVKRSDAVRARISQALSERGPISESTRQKLIAKNKGRTISPETKLKMAAASMGQQRALGHKKTIECRRVLSEKHRKLTDEQVAWAKEQSALGVYQKDIAKHLGVSQPTIHNAIRKGYVTDGNQS